MTNEAQTATITMLALAGGAAMLHSLRTQKGQTRLRLSLRRQDRRHRARASSLRSRSDGHEGAMAQHGTSRRTATCPDRGAVGASVRVSVSAPLHYLRNGAFYFRWPERVWVLDRSIATAFANWQRGISVKMHPGMRWQRVGKRAAATQHTGVQKPIESLKEVR